MANGDILRYVRARVQPDMLDMETAKRIILEHLHCVSQATFEPVGSDQLILQVVLQKQAFSHPLSIEAGDQPALEDEITEKRAMLAAREALLSLHASGVLIPYGNLIIGDGHASEETNLVLRNVHPNSPYGGFNTQVIGPIHLPSVHRSYRIAASFRENQTFRLASGDIYLSSLNQTMLPSRAKRCLRECIDAFRFGLYLSANMSVGAASESL